MQHKAAQIGMVLFALTILLISIYLRFAYVSSFARSWDEVDFAFALKQYDLLAMQPHFPGYPYFILGGTLFHKWISDPIRALAFLNILMTISSIIPIVLIVRRFTNVFKGLFFAALLLTSPYLLLMSTQPMSEAAGIAIIWWYLWSIQEALKHRASIIWSILPLCLFGILMGIRVSFFPFGVAVVLLGFVQYKHGVKSKWLKWRSMWFQLFIAVCFQLIWIGGLVWSEGSPAGFLQLSLAFIKGHFSEWGGGITSSTVPIGQRIVQFFGENLLWNSVLGHSSILGILLVTWIIVIGVGAWQAKLTKFNRPISEAIKLPNGQFIMGLMGCIGLYTLWALLGQNIEKPRHITPVVGPCLLLIYLLAIKTASSLANKKLNIRSNMLVKVLIYVILISLITTQLVYGRCLLQRQVEEKPAVYQLNDYLKQQTEPFIIFTWEETRVLQYLQAKYEHKQIFTFAYFRAEVSAQTKRRVFITDPVLEGFELQTGRSLRNHVKQLERFKSDSLFEPAYSDIIVYEWIVNS